MKVLLLSLGLIFAISVFSQKELIRNDSMYRYSELEYYNNNLQFQKIDKSTNQLVFFYDKKANKDFFNWIDFINENNGPKLSILFWKNSYKINLIAEFNNYKANGMFIWFNKRGKIDIIAEYKEDRLVDIIYYRKEKFLDKFISVFGYKPPLTQRKSEAEDINLF